MITAPVKGVWLNGSEVGEVLKLDYQQTPFLVKDFRYLKCWQGATEIKSLNRIAAFFA